MRARPPSALAVPKGKKPLSGSPMPKGEERCRKQKCSTVKEELAAERKAQENTLRELERLTRSWKQEVEGGIRRWDSEHGVPVLQARVEELSKGEYKARLNRNTMSTKAASLAGELADAMDAKAELKRQVAELKSKLAQIDARTEAPTDFFCAIDA